jgi:ribonucleoside-diphosphate reductase alpha chain
VETAEVPALGVFAPPEAVPSDRRNPNQLLPVNVLNLPASSVASTATSDPVQTAAEVLPQRHGAPILLPPRSENMLGGLKVGRTFSNEVAHPYDEVRWERRDVRVLNASGKPLFERLGVEVPTHWDENAVRITVEKYLFGSKPGTAEYEDSLKHAFDRIANTYTVWGWEEGYFAELKDAGIFNEELKAMLVQQMWAPNSPVWFNLGHWEQWRWGRPDLRAGYRGKGNRAFFARHRDDTVVAQPAEHAYAAPQASACFLTQVGDSMESDESKPQRIDGILEHLRTEGRIFSSGSGVGINISTLRSSHEPISGKGRSSGPISFNRGWDRMAGAIRSGGKTRRAARMVLMFADHPDIFDFVRVKRRQEDIAKIILRDHNVQVELRALAKNKLVDGTPAERAAARIILSLPLANETVYSPHMDELLYADTLSDQNANHSVSCKGGFWQAYHSKGEYATRWVTQPERVQQRYRPDELLDLMAEAVWENGEPGVHNSDWINLWNPVKTDGEITTSNPCSEYLHLNDTSCNLSSLNLYRFLDKKSRTFRAEPFRAAVRLAMIAADLNIERGGFPTPEIAVGTYRYRTTGIGYANLGGLLMALGLPYDSDEGRYLAAQITSLLTASAWEASEEMGRELGAYEAFARTKGDLQKVLRLHQVSHDVVTRLGTESAAVVSDHVQQLYQQHRTELPEAQGLTGLDALQALTQNFVNGQPIKESVRQVVGGAQTLAQELWARVTPEGKRFRNSFVTVLAPTGTISAPLGCYDEGTTSAEPDYTLVKWKQLSGGGAMKMFNTLALEGLRTLGYSEDYVREAAFEVAGLDALRTCCGDRSTLMQHLRWQPVLNDQGPVRQAFRRLASEAADLERLAHDLDARRYSSELTTDEALVINGMSHVESLPWLDPRHLATFDCSATNGDGTRSIRPEGHILMLGALQPFLSGATSKTVNLPESATRADIKRTFVLAHLCGVKCIAVFRSGSKANAVFFVDTPETRKLKAPYIWERMVEEAGEAITDIVAEASKPRQRKLSGRRLSQTVKFSIAGQLKGFITVSIYPDGTCGEIFGRLGQVGSFASSMFEAKCKEMSQSLQFGVPLQTIIDANRGMAFEPAGFCQVGDDTPDGRCTSIKSCASVIDLVAKTLEWLFPPENRYRLRDLVQTPVMSAWNHESGLTSVVEEARHRRALIPTPEPAGAGAERTATRRRTGDLGAASICPKCHNATMVQDGKCKTCRSCGNKDGGCGE